MRKLILGLAVLLAGCGSVVVPSGDSKQIAYGVGQDYASLLAFADMVPAIPAQACGPIKAAGTVYTAGVKILLNGTGDPQAIVQDLQTALAAALTAAAQIGFSLAQHHALTASGGDPSPAEWQALNQRIAAGVAGLRC